MGSSRLLRRMTVAGFAGLVLSALPAAPAVALPSPESASCSWQATLIAVPPGAERRSVTVTATDGAGTYVGYRTHVDRVHRLVRWQGDEPEEIALPKGVESVMPADVNRSGTVLLTGYSSGLPDGILLYRKGKYEPLPIPAPYERPRAVAINDRGDIVAMAEKPGSTGYVVIAWFAYGSGPLVISPPELPWAFPVDIDQDGTILISGGYSAYLWRSGELSPLPPSPDVPVITRALSEGRAVGTIIGEKSQAVLWYLGTPHLLEGGGNAEDINRHGLIAGGVGEWNGPPAVWQGTRLLAKLPLPQDATSARPGIVSDDGTIVGSAEPDVGPVRWRCAS